MLVRIMNRKRVFHPCKSIAPCLTIISRAKIEALTLVRLASEMLWGMSLRSALMVGMSDGMANQPKAMKKGNQERCIVRICGRPKENSFILVALPFLSRRICFGKILVASAIWCVWVYGDMIVEELRLCFCDDLANQL